MSAQFSDEQIARMFRDLYLRGGRNPGGRLVTQAANKLDELVACDDGIGRERLRKEYDHLADLVQFWLVLQGLESFGSAEREAGIERAKHARGAKYSDDTRPKAVKAVNRLRKINRRMSVNAAVKKVGSTLGIPTRTLARWVANTPD
jgi:hypothetical protein